MTSRAASPSRLDVAAYVAELAAQPGMTASRLFRILMHDWAASEFEGEKNAVNRVAAEKLGWPKFQDGMPMYRLTPVNGFNVIVPVHANTETIVATVADRIGPDTQAVIELGCGPGRHLFDIRDLVEHRVPHLKYFGTDISDVDLGICRQVAALEPVRAAITFHKFDHLAPDFSFMTGLKNVVFFTCHTIEQVTTITDKLFLGMLAAAETFVCIHEEPVGWQLNDEVLAAVQNNAFPTTPRIVKPFQPVDDYAAAATPVGSRWNLNLVPVLRDLVAQGKIKIERVDKHCSGMHLYNPTTRIVWTRA